MGLGVVDVVESGEGEGEVVLIVVENGLSVVEAQRLFAGKEPREYHRQSLTVGVLDIGVDGVDAAFRGEIGGAVGGHHCGFLHHLRFWQSFSRGELGDDGVCAVDGDSVDASGCSQPNSSFVVLHDALDAWIRQSLRSSQTVSGVMCLVVQDKSVLSAEPQAFVGVEQGAIEFVAVFQVRQHWFVWCNLVSGGVECENAVLGIYEHGFSIQFHGSAHGPVVVEQLILVVQAFKYVLVRIYIAEKFVEVAHQQAFAVVEHDAESVV